MRKALLAPPVPPTPPRNGCLTAFMVIVGIVLLLPGLCAIVFGVGNLGSSSPDPMITLLVFLGLLVGFGGIMLIRAAIRGPRP
jgi:hypothetical protein